MPDGVVCAVHPKKKGSVLWQHKFESPVVHVWQLIGLMMSKFETLFFLTQVMLITQMESWFH